MTGPIAAIAAIMISVATALGSADCSVIAEEAARIAQEAKEKEEASKYLVAIDAGHQEHGNFGQEPIGPGASETKTKVAGGTRGTYTGVPEYELTLDISLQLRDELEKRGYRVLMIRETNDVDITNSERAQMANEANADAFIRVHANGSESSSANGAMTICQTSSNPYNGGLYEESKRLSELVLDAYTQATGIRKERIWETDSMSGINWCEVPVTIIEMGYMTNPEEDEKMQDDDFQVLMVQGIADGVEEFLNEKKESEQEEGTEPAEAESFDTGLRDTTPSTATEPSTDTDTEGTEESSTGVSAQTEQKTEDEPGSGIEERKPNPGEGGTESAAEIEPETADDKKSDEEVMREEEERKKEEERLKEEERRKEEKEREEKAQAARDALSGANTVPSVKTEKSAKEVKDIVEETGKDIIKRCKKEQEEEQSAQTEGLEAELREEIGKLGGKWSLYLKRLDTNQVIGINEDEKMVSASLIKLFIAGEFFTLAEEGELDADDYSNMPDVMITISDNGAANSLINACSMEKINEFIREHGYKETELNRKMLEWNGTENYTSTRDCGRLLEEVLNGKYVSEKASERILTDLKNQTVLKKIPAGVPSGIETGNKTGELDNVDNDAAIVWSPNATYILVIMSSDTSGRIDEIRKLSSMVYNSINGQTEGSESESGKAESSESVQEQHKSSESESGKPESSESVQEQPESSESADEQQE